MEVGESEVRRTAARAFPEADSVTVHGNGITGVGGITYMFTVSEHGSKYVLKFAPEEATDRLQNGAEIYRYLNARTDIPVPAVRTVERVGEEVMYPYTIVEYVTGDELSSIQQFKSFSRSRKKAVIRGMGRALATLHQQTEFDTYGSVSVQSDLELTVNDGDLNWRDYYLSAYEEYTTMAEGSPVTDFAERSCEFFERVSEKTRRDRSRSVTR